MADPSTKTNMQTTADQAGQNNRSEAVNKGLWVNLSAEKKRDVKTGSVVLAIVIVILISFANHRSAVIAASKSPIDQSDVLNAEHLASTAPSPVNFLNLSMLYYNAKRFNDCVIAARKAIALKPDYPEAYNNVAAGFLKMSQWDSAAASASEAILLKPDFQLAKNNLAAANDGRNARQENLLKLEKTASEQPTAENYLSLSASYYQASQFENCIAAARKALQLKPGFAAAYTNICAANNKLGNFEEGKKAGEEAVRIDPNNQLAQNNLKWSINNLDKK